MTSWISTAWLWATSLLLHCPSLGHRGGLQTHMASQAVAGKALGSTSLLWRELSFFCFVLFCFLIYDSHRERERHRQREKQTPFREPNVGLDPTTPGSRPGLKAGSKSLSHPRIPGNIFFKHGDRYTNRNFGGHFTLT